MKTMNTKMWMSALVFAAVSTGAVAYAKDSSKISAEKVKKETVEAVDAAGVYAGEKKEEFQARMKNNLNEMDREIEELKKESESKSAEVREAAKRKIQAVQKKRDELNAKYEAFEKSTSKAWTRMKSGMEKAWGEVRAAYTDAKTELKK